MRATPWPCANALPYRPSASSRCLRARRSSSRSRCLQAEVILSAVVWPTPKGWLILLYVALVPSLLSQMFYMRGVELIGPGRAGLFVNLVPIFGALLVVLLLGEPFRAYHALALALVLGGIWLAERGRGG